MKMSMPAVKVVCGIFLIQFIFTLIFLFRIFHSEVVHKKGKDIDYIFNENGDLKAMEISMEGESLNLSEERKERDLNEKTALRPIYIYSKASIGIYLWEHILQAKRFVDQQQPGVLKGTWIHNNFNFSYLEGPGVDFGSSFESKGTLVLILNGRTQKKVSFSKKWLNHFLNSKVLLILLGNEECDNGWLKEYIYPKGPVHGVFLVYDDASIDDKIIYQWPLGVATYRQFPSLSDEQIRSNETRKYMCNLLATNYRKSSRSLLLKILRDNMIAADRCLVSERTNRETNESTKAMNHYILSLIQSDLTLCPSGFNVETYRIYEAMEAGSIPVVVEDSLGSQCDPKSSLRLLKRFNAPFIWIKTWNDLPQLLATEQRLSEGQKIQRRRKLRDWYSWFKQRMKFRFLSFFDRKLFEPM